MKNDCLTKFPEFKYLELRDKNEVVNFTQNFPPYSDFNFTSLWTYNTEDDIQLSILNNNLVVRFRDYITNKHFYSFIGNSNASQTIATLLEFSKENGINPMLKLIPEVNLINDSLSNNFTIQEDPDNFDYILSVPEWSNLTESKYFKQRKTINRFSHQFPDCQIKTLDLQDNKTIKDMFQLFETWKNSKNREDSDHERTAIKRAIASASVLDIYAIGMYKDTVLIGYIITDLSHSTYIQSHFSKYDPSYTGITNVLRNYLAKKLEVKGYTYMNIEQDLGILSIRMAKKICRPVNYLKKYIVTY